MGFYLLPKLSGSSSAKQQKYSLEFLHKQQCNVCPLNNQKGLQHPNMQPTGSKHPVIYIIAEAPGAEEDAKGVQLIGRSGRLLRPLIPDEWLDKIRWNNCVRTRPPENRTPTPMELECCRPSVAGDIEQTKPVAVFGFGGVALAGTTPAAKRSGQ